MKVYILIQEIEYALASTIIVGVFSTLSKR